jgi:hypothetical protein
MGKNPKLRSCVFYNWIWRYLQKFTPILGGMFGRVEFVC